MGCQGETSHARNFALVSYIPARLGRFLDSLRAELKDGCVLRSHVTILPPRPIEIDIAAAVRQITDEAHESAPFTVELSSVEIFAQSHVVYLKLKRGARELQSLHASLNAGQLKFKAPFPYHPHITLAQDVTREEAEALAEIARERWSGYDGPREFCVETLSFVRSKKPGVWLDLAHVELSQPVAAR